MLRANILTSLEGPWKGGEYGESGESGDFGEIWSRLLTKCFKRIYQRDQQGPENVGEFGENGESGESGDFGEIWSRLLTKYFKRIY